MKRNYKSGSWWPDKLYTLLLGVIVWTIIIFLFGCSDTKQSSNITEQNSITYYCPMHPNVVSDKPDKCPRPECKGMDLIPKTSDSTLGSILKPVNSAVLASIRTTKPVYKKMPLYVEANGYIDFDTRTMNNVSSFYSGRLEKLYVKYAYQQVHKGQILFEVYSPELISAEQNLIYILSSDPEEKPLIESAKQKLILLGFGKNLLNELMSSKKVMMTVPVYSKYEGLIHLVMEMKTSSEMNSSKQNYQDNQELPVKEGMYVMAGQTIFNIVDPHTLAVVLQIKSENIAKISKGMEVTMTMEDKGMNMSGKIDFIDPFFKEGAKTMTARVFIENARHNHKVGSLVKAKIKCNESESLWIPASALVDLGKEKIVWLKMNGIFFTQKVVVGMFANGMVEITDGLTEENEIAIESHYLIDSEGFVKTNSNED